MSKLFKILTYLLLASLVLAACGPSATPTEVMTEAPTEPVMTEEPAITEEPVAEAPAMCMGAQPGDELTVMYQWSGAEEESFNSIVKPLLDACGIQLVSQSTRDDAVLDTAVKSTPPDVLFWPNLSPLKLYSGQLMALDTVGATPSNYASFWMDFGAVDGKWATIPAKLDVKSIIWYNPAQFAAFGYEVPTTMEELDALVEQMVADGNVPWSMGNNNGGPGDGWSGTDFVQDILLSTQGADYVNRIISGEVPYNDQPVVDAYTLYQKWASDPAYTVGGADGTVNTKFLDAIYKVYSEQPEAMMVKQSGFAGGEAIKQFPNLQSGVDVDFFEFPGLQGVQGGGDFMYVFGDSPAAQALVAYVTSAEGGQTWASTGFGLSPNTGATGNYADEQTAKLGDILSNASGFTFDMGDGLGAPFNEAEFKAIIDVVQGADVKSTLDTVAEAQATTVSQ
jgi:alpha-glucoside transport system substrate-binding protein